LSGDVSLRTLLSADSTIGTPSPLSIAMKKLRQATANSSTKSSLMSACRRCRVMLER
jgi:hypothetical protein